MRFRIMTYNVHSCIGLDGRCSPLRIAKTIARFAPDIVALQELDLGRIRTRGHDQPRMIAKHLRMFHHYHPAIQVEEELYGDAILSRYPLRVRRADLLRIPTAVKQKEPRGALWVTAALPGLDIQVINTHLGLGKKERFYQAQALAGTGWLGHPDCCGPRILCGDFNTIPGSRPFDQLSQHLHTIHNKNKLRDRWPGGTWPSFFPLARIDHILVSSHFRVLSAGVPMDRRTIVASDHLPLVADLDIKIRGSNKQKNYQPNCSRSIFRNCVSVSSMKFKVSSNCFIA